MDNQAFLVLVEFLVILVLLEHRALVALVVKVGLVDTLVKMVNLAIVDTQEKVEQGAILQVFSCIKQTQEQVVSLVMVILNGIMQFK
jgi:hypothetical protein